MEDVAFNCQLCLMQCMIAFAFNWQLSIHCYFVFNCQCVCKQCHKTVKFLWLFVCCDSVAVFSFPVDCG